ncbi:hypothetical protein [Actinomyces succiniciruminis]|uniref:Major capsid protein n=1 Tax=Actinomyces succiniciruminis TaxID=1522002 RepID=A0A1L7RG05_9ACTO|nr:hypothetical protein [Actinomyces succiniciruminis]CED90266.1 Hypothetical protein AAM4_0371 [Actinomyces succiniciruminis]
MPSYTYPVAAPNRTLTTEEIHILLTNTRVLARRLADLTQMRFVADYLLSGRFDATGGGIFYETGEEIFAADAPEAVAPGSEYPKTVLTAGELASARTVKWGIETDITDEKIAQQGQVVVDRALARLANTVIRHVDATAWGVIASKVTSTEASAAWTTPGAALEAIVRVQEERAALGTGLDLSTVVLAPAQYAKVLAMLVDADALPRNDSNPVLDGTLPLRAFGLEWVTSPHVTGTDPWLIDRAQLGGMADQTLGSPGYVSASGVGIETLSNRHKDDKYEVRARRVTVPVVTEPMAGVRITGTGL